MSGECELNILPLTQKASRKHRIQRDGIWSVMLAAFATNFCNSEEKYDSYSDYFPYTSLLPLLVRPVFQVTRISIIYLYSFIFGCDLPVNNLSVNTNLKYYSEKLL